MQPAEPTVTATNDGRSAQVIQIDSGKHVQIVVMCAVMCTITMLGTIWALYQSSVAERETRMTQYYILELDAKLVAAGFKTDDETVASRLRKAKEN